MYKLNTWLAAGDERISSALYLGETPGWRRTLAMVITHSGDGLPFLLFLGVLFLLGGPEWRVRVIVMLATDVLTFLVVQTLKFLVRRSRPVGEWGQMYRRLDPYSFPSGHSARGGSMAMMALLLGPTWFGVLFVIWGVAVAFSRVILGVHFFSDAISGFVLGITMALTMWLLVINI